MKFVAALAVAALAGSAQAAVIQMTFSGPVQFSNMTAFPVGQQVNLTFTYESSGSPQFIANQQAFYVDHFLFISLQTSSYNAFDANGFGQINKYDNLGNTDGIQFQVAANQQTYQFTNPKPQAVQFPDVFSNNVIQSFDNMFVNYASASNNVWSDYNLPTTYNDAQFNGTRNMGFAFSGGSFQVGDMTVTSQVLPTPGTAALMTLGATMMYRRRRQA